MEPKEDQKEVAVIPCVWWGGCSVKRAFIGQGLRPLTGLRKRQDDRNTISSNISHGRTAVPSPHLTLSFRVFGFVLVDLSGQVGGWGTILWAELEQVPVSAPPEYVVPGQLPGLRSRLRR